MFVFRDEATGRSIDPGTQVFRQGGTLDDHRMHWFRSKFFQQYWLFYWFNSDAKVIVLAWVNDEKTLRAYGRKIDADATFRGMLDGGNQPETFDALMKEAMGAAERFAEALKGAPDP
ncbi:type II toxin-antitoxin system YhaV family toxin [Sulfitobacter sp. AS92]|uniref:type II toxin-antitoxin system YhaV family toxin n=1 Tax=Sulfitobacter sp. AS92 TaxID=3135783 RepID=UPI00317ACC1C